jgi:hypothetical protein
MFAPLSSSSLEKVESPIASADEWVAP